MKGGGRWEQPPGRGGDEVGSGVFKRGTVLRSVQVRLRARVGLRFRLRLRLRC